MKNKNNNLPDFVNEAIIIPIELGGIRTYASVNEIFHHKGDELCPMGTYFVYLLHYRLGSCHFTMEPHGDTWIPVEANESIELEIFQLLSETIYRTYQQ